MESESHNYRESGDIKRTLLSSSTCSWTDHSEDRFIIKITIAILLSSAE